jgi:hypothetical protein
MDITPKPSGPVSSRHPKAVVEVLVEKFRDIFTAEGNDPCERGTQASLKLRHENPKVKIEDGEIIVYAYGAHLEFVISEGYYPVGITFKLLSGVKCPDDVELLGHLNFSPAKICPGDHSLFVTDEYRDLGGNNKYKFSIIIQRASDGAIGIIDPNLIHRPN